MINNKFIYWLIGWVFILRHPIMGPIDLVKSVELLFMDSPKKGTKK